MGLRLVTAPTTFPVTTAEAKAHCRVEDSSEDGLIEALIAAATDYVEQWTGKALVTQTWRLTLDAFSESIMLPKNPVLSVASITYFDVDGDIQTVSPSDYTVDNASNPAWLVINSDASWPATASGVNMVRVEFIAGYTTIPASIKHAILLLVGQWFDYRASVSEKSMAEMPFAVESLLRPYRDMVL